MASIQSHWYGSTSQPHLTDFESWVCPPVEATDRKGTRQPTAVQSFSKGDPHVSSVFCRPTFDVILAKLLAMRQSLGSAPTPPLQRYKLQSKAAKEAAEQLKQDNTANTAEVWPGGDISPRIGCYIVTASSYVMVVLSAQWDWESGVISRRQPTLCTASVKECMPCCVFPCAEHCLRASQNPRMMIY